jgi:hypothetical protein
MRPQTFSQMLRVISRIRASTICALSLALCAVAGSASAQAQNSASSTDTKAVELFREGRRLLDAKQYPEACALSSQPRAEAFTGHLAQRRRLLRA